MARTGNCRLLLGPMFSKKTTRLIEELGTLTDVRLKCLLTNHSEHQRETAAGDNYVSTHHTQYRGVSPKIQKCIVDRLADVSVDSFDAIGIDEGQFFEDLNDCVRDWVFNKGKIVIVASLDADSNMKPFGQAHDLECICEQQNVVRLTAFCKVCLKQKRLVNASFTAKLISGGAQKDVGGADKYMPVCMKCYIRHSSRAQEPVIRVDQLEAMALPGVRNHESSAEGTPVLSHRK